MNPAIIFMNMHPAVLVTFSKEWIYIRSRFKDQQRPPTFAYVPVSIVQHCDLGIDYSGSPDTDSDVHQLLRVKGEVMVA